MKRSPKTAKLNLSSLGFFEVAAIGIERGFIGAETYKLKPKYQTLKILQETSPGLFLEKGPKRKTWEMLDVFHQLFSNKKYS